MAVLAHGSTLRLQHAARAAEEEWTGALARAAAGQATPHLESGDVAGLETALRDIAAMPTLREVRVLDRAGRPVLVLAQAADGRVVRGDATAKELVLEAEAAPRAWAGAGPGSSLGSVGITYRTVTGDHPFARLRYDVIGATAFVGLLMLVAASLFVARAVRPLQRLATFSRGLAAGGGRRIDVDARSREVAELAEALNDAAATMAQQFAALKEHDFAQAALLNAVPDVLIGMDDQCCIRLVNPGVRAVFGLEPEEAAGLPLQHLLPGIDAAEAELRTMQGLYMRSTKTHVARFELEARRSDGTPFPTEVSLTRTETAEGPRYAALVRDLTESRMTTDLVHLFSRALECTTNGVVISDVTLPGQPVFYANPAFYRITGFEPGDTIGRNCSFLQRGDSQQPEIDELRSAVAERRSAQVVLRNYRSDGTLFFNELAIAPVSEPDGDVRHYVGVLNDVTERERARMAIAERSARLNAVFDLSPDGFVVFDGNSRLVYCNRAFLDMTGWHDDPDVHGLTIEAFEERLLAQCDPAQRPRPLAQALAEGAAGDEAAGGAPETMYVTRPERRVLARVARSLRDGHIESILFFRDVTRETEVDRMKSEFLTTAAHELRTPMVSVFGFTELLLRRHVPEERRRDMLETIHRQASLLIHMVNELLDLARIEARQGKDIRRVACRIDTLVANAVEPLRLGPRGADIAIDLADGDAEVCVDAEKTQQALTNVLSNAVKYSPQGGPIVVTTRRGELHGRPALGVRISDRGIGMTPEQASRIFERFYRADPSGNIPGTGLGMCLVKEIVELHGGRVEIASDEGRGTTVTLWWELESAAATHAAPARIAG
ncbi:MAG: PAS domain S-box protein [Rubrivivax sp.]|nr:PAS domain S-box protein [Rubrivivax sp.]